MELIGFYPNEDLIKMMENDEITSLDYVNHLSEDFADEFKNFCKKNKLTESEDSATKFIESVM